MKIAVAAEGNSLESVVAKDFTTCKALLIVTMPEMTIQAVENTAPENGESLAQKVVAFDCEALIIGALKEPEFEILADACVTRYIGDGHSVEKSLDLMERRCLRMIRNMEGTDDCSGTHHHYHHH